MIDDALYNNVAVNNSSNLYTTGSVGASKGPAEAPASTKPTRGEKVSFDDGSTTYTSIEGDTLKLSAEGMESVSQMKAVEQTQDAAQMESAADSTAASATGVDTNNLSQYSSTELLTFLNDGSINQAEYSAEIAARQNA